MQVCCITYARIQGRSALVQHFQNSSLLTEDKRCRPMLFDNSGNQLEFPDAPMGGAGGTGGGAGRGQVPSGVVGIM